MSREAPPTPADVCRRLLAAMEASEGRRARRKRDTAPDAIGLAMKHRLLEQAVRENPPADGFEGWLLDRCLAAGRGSGSLRAVALDVLDEWRLAAGSEAFRAWLARGAPSDDAADRPAPQGARR